MLRDALRNCDGVFSCAGWLESKGCAGGWSPQLCQWLESSAVWVVDIGDWKQVVDSGSSCTMVIEKFHP
jgi:hypothetical protein